MADGCHRATHTVVFLLLTWTVQGLGSVAPSPGCMSTLEMDCQCTHITSTSLHPTANLHPPGEQQKCFGSLNSTALPWQLLPSQLYRLRYIKYFAAKAKISVLSGLLMQQQNVAPSAHLSWSCRYPELPGALISIPFIYLLTYHIPNLPLTSDL